MKHNTTEGKESDGIIFDLAQLQEKLEQLTVGLIIIWALAQF
jgi:hypothetical protein